MRLRRALLLATLAAATQPALADDTPAKQGEQLFTSAGCGWCHTGGGRVAGKGPKLAGTARDDDFIRFRIKHGKEGAMPAFGGAFNDAQITSIIAYIRSLKATESP